MPLSDGCNESKPTDTPSDLHNTSTGTPTQRPIGTRRRFSNLFRPKQRAETGAISVQVSRNITVSDAPVNDQSPMRFITPRATDSMPVATPQERRRTCSFMHRQSNRKSKLGLVASPISTQSDPNELLHSTGHIPVTERPYQLPARKDSVAMPTSPTKEAALTSHPVRRVDEVESEKSEKFMTPMSEKGDALGRD
jgi:hypothetical protein